MSGKLLCVHLRNTALLDSVPRISLRYFNDDKICLNFDIKRRLQQFDDTAQQSFSARQCVYLLIETIKVQVRDLLDEDDWMSVSKYALALSNETNVNIEFSSSELALATVESHGLCLEGLHHRDNTHWSSIYSKLSLSVRVYRDCHQSCTLTAIDRETSTEACAF